MSSDADAPELPPKSAPLSERLSVAMTRAGYSSQRALARDLETDGSLVGKWLHGDVKRITNRAHRHKLPVLLRTPDDYFVDDQTQADHLAELEEEVDELTIALRDAERLNNWLVERVKELQAHVGLRPRRGQANPPKPLARSAR